MTARYQGNCGQKAVKSSWLLSCPSYKRQVALRLNLPCIKVVFSYKYITVWVLFRKSADTHTEAPERPSKWFHNLTKNVQRFKVSIVFSIEAACWCRRMFYSDVEGVVCTSGTSTDVYLEQVGDNVQKQPLPAAIIRVIAPSCLLGSIYLQRIFTTRGRREGIPIVLWSQRVLQRSCKSWLMFRGSTPPRI